MALACSGLTLAQQSFQYREAQPRPVWPSVGSRYGLQLRETTLLHSAVLAVCDHGSPDLSRRWRLLASERWLGRADSAPQYGDSRQRLEPSMLETSDRE